MEKYEIGILLLIPMISITGIVNIDAGGTPIAGILIFTRDFCSDWFANDISNICCN